jgi:adenylate cyclase
MWVSVFALLIPLFVVRAPFQERMLIGLVGGVCMTLSFALNVALANVYVLPRLRFASFLLTVVAVAAVFLLVILSSLALSGLSVATLVLRRPPFSPEVLGVTLAVVNQTTVGVAFAVMLLITLVTRLSRMVGPGVLVNWVTGRYHRPREEERVFMFLDMRDSTRLGEELGDVRFSALIQAFFDDLTEPVLLTGGEVSHYIGDEAVLSWKAGKGLASANCFRCFELVKQAVAERADDYQRTFGVVPGFKAGAHIGSVVSTQVGEIKSEVVFHGDVLNTTSRIQGLCNDYGEELLCSGQLAEAVVAANPEGVPFEVVPLGEASVKGKAEPVRVCAVRPLPARPAAEGSAGPRRSRTSRPAEGVSG